MHSDEGNIFKEILSSVPGLVYQIKFRKDGTRYWTYMSPSGIEMLGLEEDFIGKGDIAEGASPEERNKLLLSLEKSVKNMTKWEYQFQYTKPDGESIWLHCTGMPSPDGDEVSMSGVLVDITESKLTQNLLKESEEKYTKAFNKTPYPVYITTLPDGVFIEVNNNFCKVSGYTRKELIGKAVSDLNFYRDSSEREKLINKLKRDKKLTNYKIDFRVKSGNFRECALFSEIVEIGGKPALLTTVNDLTDQNAAQKALISSETLYRSLFQNASDGIFLMKKEVFVECNPKIIELFGCSDESDIIGKSPADFSPEFQAHGERSEIIAQKYIGRAYKGKPQSFEWVHKKLNGREFNAEINLSRMQLDGDLYLLAIVRDIDRRKAIEAELIELQEYLHLQIERMPIGLIVWDTEFNIKSWNPSAEGIFGYKEGEVLGKNPNSIIVPENIKADTDSIMKRLLEGDESANSTNSNITKSGKKIICEWSNIPLKNNEGEVIGVLSMVQDVTDQKRAESELKTYQDYLEDLVRERTAELEVANTNLDERERLVRLLSDITSASNLSDDPEEAIFYAIERMSMHMGWQFGHMVYIDEVANKNTPSGIWYASDELRDSRISELLEECKFESPDCPINKVLKSRSPQQVELLTPSDCSLVNHLVENYDFTNSYVFPIEIENRIIGVIQFIFSGRGYPIRKYDEIASQISIQLGMAIERKRISEELLLEKYRAEDASRSKSQFLANMSHEIRTPMNSILGFADILSTRMSNKKDQSYLESITSSGTTLMQLLNDILDLSKVEAGKLEVNLSEVSLDPFINDIFDLFRSEIEEKGLYFNINIDRQIPESIITDKLRLRQIIVNIMSNAVKFTDRGGLTFSIEGSNIKNDSFNLKISIKDSGVGISEEFKEQLFDAFQQEDGDIARRFEGSGLGLAIARLLVKNLNGEIIVDSVKGKGSTFTVIIRNVEICKTITSKRQEKQINSDTIRFKDSKVLLLEDIKDDQVFFDDLMSNAGLSVTVVDNGQDALKILDYLLPDLIITDIRMPVMDGFEFVEKLKSIPTLKSIPVIAITASAMKEDIIRLEKNDFIYYLVKPVNMSDFYSTLMKILPFEGLDRQDKSTIDQIIDPIPGEVLDRLPELLNQIDLLFLGDWEKLRKKQAIEKVQQFGSDLKSFGIDNNIEMIRTYGESILLSVDSFNVVEIKKELNNFPKLLKELKSLI